MHATRIVLVTLCAALLVGSPVQAEPEPASEDPCPVVQTMPREPFVTVHPDCIDAPSGARQQS